VLWLRHLAACSGCALWLHLWALAACPGCIKPWLRAPAACSCDQVRLLVPLGESIHLRAPFQYISQMEREWSVIPLQLRGKRQVSINLVGELIRVCS